MKEDTPLTCDLKEVCKDIRCDIMTCIGHLGVGHIGGCLSVVEALAVLYFKAGKIYRALVYSCRSSGFKTPYVKA